MTKVAVPIIGSSSQAAIFLPARSPAPPARRPSVSGAGACSGSSHVSKRAAIQRRITEFRPSNVRAKSPAPRGLWPDARGTARSPPGRGRGDVSSPATPPAAEPSLPRRAWALTAPSRIGGRLLRRVVGHCSSSEAAYSSGPLGSGAHRTCRSTSPRLPSRSVHQRMPKQCCTTPRRWRGVSAVLG